MPDGTFRAPIVSGIIRAPWFAETAVELDRRVVPYLQLGRSLPKLIDAMLAGGLTVATPEPQFMHRSTSRFAEVRGLLVVAGPDVSDDLTERTLDAALALCPLLTTLAAAPQGRHEVNTECWYAFAEAFTAAASFLDEALPSGAAIARDIAQSLIEGTDRARWIHGCTALERAWRTREP